ncbi:MAG: hypothetical protein ACJAYB_002388 [Psychromonas sp.]|jgi:hypothetical protein
MGVIWAKEVDLSGQERIDYDEGLADLETSCNGEAKISYCAFYYYYPKDNDTPDILDVSAYSGYCGGIVEEVDDDKDKKR